MKRSLMILVSVLGVLLFGGLPVNAQDGQRLGEADYLKADNAPQETGYVIIETEDSQGNVVHKRLLEEDYERLARRTAQQAESRYALPPVKLVQKDLYRHAYPVPENSGPQSWGKIRIGADILNSKISGKDTVIVAVADTGVDGTHPFLKNRMVPGYDFIRQSTNTDDVEGHGTHVSGIVVDSTNPNVKIMPIRVLGDDGYGTDFVISEGVRYAADHGADIINLSLGGPGDTPYMKKAIDYAISKGVLVVVAAGNEHDDTANYSPASHREALVVASSQNDDQLSEFSNYGDSVDITAPGSYIDSSLNGGGYGELSGTSMATPYVAGVAAMLKTEDASLSNIQLKERLLEYTDDLGETGWDPYYGEGILNISAYRLKQDTRTAALISPRENAEVYGNVEVKVYTKGHIGERIQVFSIDKEVMSQLVEKDGIQQLSINAEQLGYGTHNLVIRIDKIELPLSVRTGQFKNTIRVDTMQKKPAESFLVSIIGIADYKYWYPDDSLVLASGNGLNGKADLRFDLDEWRDEFSCIVAVVKSRDRNVPVYIRELSKNGEHHFTPQDEQWISLTADLPESAQSKSIYSDLRLNYHGVLLPKMPLYAGPATQMMGYYADRGNHLAIFSGEDFIYHEFTENKKRNEWIAGSSNMFEFNIKRHAASDQSSNSRTANFTEVTLYAKQMNGGFVDVWQEKFTDESNVKFLKNDDYRAVLEETLEKSRVLSVYRDFNQSSSATERVFKYGGPITGGFLLNTESQGLTGKVDFKDSYSNTLFPTYSFYPEWDAAVQTGLSPVPDSERFPEIKLIGSDGEVWDSSYISSDNNFEFYQYVPDGNYVLSFDYQNSLFPVTGSEQEVSIRDGRFVADPPDTPLLLQPTVKASIRKGEAFTMDLKTVFGTQSDRTVHYTSSEGTLRNNILTVQPDKEGTYNIDVTASYDQIHYSKASLQLIVKQPLESKRFETKQNVPLDKVWTISVNREYKAADVRSVRVYENGHEKAVTLKHQPSEKNFLVLPVTNYTAGADCAIHIDLKNGKSYKMNFTTAK